MHLTRNFVEENIKYLNCIDSAFGSMDNDDGFEVTLSVIHLFRLSGTTLIIACSMADCEVACYVVRAVPVPAGSNVPLVNDRTPRMARGESAACSSRLEGEEQRPGARSLSPFFARRRCVKRLRVRRRKFERLNLKKKA